MGATVEQLKASLEGAEENYLAAQALLEQTRDRLTIASRKRADVLQVRQAFLIIADDLRSQQRAPSESPQDIAFSLTQAVEEQDLGHEIEVSEAQESVLVGKYGDAAEVIEELCEALAREAEEVEA